MAKSRPSKRQNRALNTLQEKGLGLCALGIGMLFIPLFMGSSPMLQPIATCASCGTKVVDRTSTKGGADFWGCSGYPKCQSRLPMAALR